MPNLFPKHPVETYPIGVDYSSASPSGATLISGVWSAWDQSTGSDASALVLQSTTAVIVGTVARVRVQAGILDHLYQLSLTATFDTGDVLHDYVDMLITQSG